MKRIYLNNVISLIVLLIVVAALALSGCSGSDGSSGATGATGTTGATGATGPAGKDAGTNVAALSTTDLTALSLSPTDSKVTGVTISSPPVVKFTLKDAAGRGITGLGFTSKSSTATVAGLTNIQFILAKLVPGTNGSPSRWINYGVTTVPTTTAPNVVPRLPATDSTGTLKDNGDGTYEYTFYRDITKVKSVVAAATVTAPSDVADLDDLTYDPTLTHRLVIQIGGNTRGTGTNTANAVQVTPGVPMANPINLVYDFIPATGKAVAATDTQREIVKVANCFECHGKFSGIHGGNHLQGTPGSRQDTRTCVLCHTEQQKYGFAEVTTTATGYTGDTRKINGQAVGYFPAFIHRLHMGDELNKTGYSFAGVLFNEVTYPQDKRNCRKCHAGDSTAQLADTPQGNNWKTNPSRAACGACHDQVDFTTGANHIGGRQTTDALCTICHADVDIELYHIPVAPPNPDNVLAGGTVSITNAASIAPYLTNLPAGASKISYDVSSVSVSAGKPVIKFKFKKDGTDVVFNTYSATGKTELMDNFVGSPSVYFTFAVPQDNIASPADFNASVSGYIKRIWNGTATGTSAGTISGPDTSGYYTITLTGVTIPATATMFTGGVGFTYSLTTSAATTTQPLTQTNVSGYPFDAAKLTGGLIVRTPVIWKVATGYTARRNIVENARCDKCHAQLGVTPTFHAGQRNDAQVCNWCHRPNQTSSGWSARSSNFIHGIHGAEKRSVPFGWHSPSLTDGYWNVTFPGTLKNCETCHLPGTYDFSGSAYTDALMNNQLYTTVASGATALNPSATTALSPYVTAGTIYGTGYSYNAATGAVPATTEAAGTTLVSSPIATACFACHDTALDKAHMESNGGSIYQVRSTALAKAEQCLLCHGPGRVAAIKDMHSK